METTKAARVLSGVLLCVSLLPGQKTPSSGSAPASASPAGVSLTGLSYANGDWDHRMPDIPNRVILCYRLAATQSASQPFTLEPTPPFKTKDERNNGLLVPCAAINATHPMTQRQTVVLAIDARNVNLTRIKVP
jgi:hypothetical protein